ncbi:MAG: phosphate ABC transporter ATP-binding protein [Pseudomonadota bacterium]
MPDAIELQDVVLSRGGQQVIDGLTLSLVCSGLTAIMGPNGAGKSLTLRLIAGLIVPDAGSVRFDGGAPAARDLAVVFQSPVMLRRSVKGNLTHALRLRGIRGAALRDRVSELLKMGGLQDVADRPARQLSGGEKQRLALVRALAVGPKFLLLDEPTASLDPTSTAEIERLIREARADGTRVILITHDRFQAKRLADEVVFLHKGKLIEVSPVPKFFDAPASAEARAYLNGELLT